ncbi:hypothetical protein GCM10017744_103770 [Streptomyces antimycoticus]|nr:hypothetical protein [Streptomyces antimycoticus]
MSITITNTYGTAHNVSENNPAHVTSCDYYRLPLVGTIAPGDPGYEDMVEILKENGHDTRPEGYGLIFLESEEFRATYFGLIEQIEKYKRENVDCKATFDASQGKAREFVDSRNCVTRNPHVDRALTRKRVQVEDLSGSLGMSSTRLRRQGSAVHGPQLPPHLPGRLVPASPKALK